MRKKTFVFVLTVLVFATLLLLFTNFTNKVLFAVVIVATFAGMRAGGVRGIAAARHNFWLALLLLSIFVAACIIAMSYLVFLEMFVGACDGFFAVLAAKAYDEKFRRTAAPRRSHKSRRV
jgi:hypothetical protein